MKEFNKNRYVPGCDNNGDDILSMDVTKLNLREQIQVLKHKLRLAVGDIQNLELFANMAKAEIKADYERILERDATIKQLQASIDFN